MVALILMMMVIDFSDSDDDVNDSLDGHRYVNDSLDMTMIFEILLKAGSKINKKI